LGDTTMDKSSITFNDATTFTTGNLAMTTNSTIALPQGSMASQNVTIAGGSSITLGAGVTFGAASITVDGGTLILGAGDHLNVAGGVTVQNGGIIEQLGTDGNLIAVIGGPLTVQSGGVWTVGPTGSISSGDLLVDGGAINL